MQLTDLKQATIANTLSRMQRDGFIHREVNLKDARSQIIKLTDTSYQLKDAAMHIARGINQQSLSVLTTEEQMLFLQMMNRVIDKQKSMVDGQQ